MGNRKSCFWQARWRVRGMIFLRGRGMKIPRLFACLAAAYFNLDSNSLRMESMLPAPSRTI